MKKLLGERRQDEPEPAPDIFTAAAAAKTARKRALLGTVTGRAAHQPRDEQGRFTGFDGGVRRQSAPPRAETHEETLLTILSNRAAAVGRNF